MVPESVKADPKCVVVIATVLQVRSRGSNSPSAAAELNGKVPQRDEEVLVVTAMGWNLFPIASPLVKQEDLVGWQSGQRAVSANHVAASALVSFQQGVDG